MSIFQIKETLKEWYENKYISKEVLNEVNGETLKEPPVPFINEEDKPLLGQVLTQALKGYYENKYISKEEIKEMFNEVCGETITGHPNRETMVEMSRRYAEESEQKEEFNLDVLKEKIKQRKVFIKNYLKKWTND